MKVLVCLPLVLAMGAFAQTRPAQRNTTGIPRMPDGKPNLNGIWQAMTTANWDLEDHSAQPGPVVQLGALDVTPAGYGVIEGGAIPYKPEALAKKKENFANRVKLDPEAKCYLPGLPRATYMPYPFEIIQSDKDMLLSYTYDDATRIIHMAPRHSDAELDTWMGTSNGRWEGDTLVIDVTGFNGRAWLDRAGNFASDSLHVTERYTMLDPNTIDYEATVEDPTVFTKSWKINLPLYRHREKNARLLELNCVPFVEEMMYGDVSKKPAQ